MSKLANFRKNLALLLGTQRGRKSQIADQAGITDVHLSYLLSGRSDPSADVFIRLADALGVSLDDFVALPNDLKEKRPNLAKIRVPKKVAKR